jgi:hypothetical protein
MATRILLAVFIVLTFICGGIAIYYNRVFESLQVALADTRSQLADAQARLKEQRSALPAKPQRPAPSSDSKARK